MVRINGSLAHNDLKLSFGFGSGRFGLGSFGFGLLVLVAFRALDGVTGKLLWQVHLDSGIISQPVAYRGPDGRQYVAVLTGVGGWSGALVSAQLDKRDKSAALGFVNAVQDLPDKTRAGGRLYVFALPR